MDERTAFAHDVAMGVARHLPEHLARERIDAVFADQLNLGAVLTAMSLGLPTATISTTPPFMRPEIPDWPARIPTDELRASLGLVASDENSLRQGISKTVHLLPWLAPMDVAPAPPQAVHIGLLTPDAHDGAGAVAPLTGRPRVLVSVSTNPMGSFATTAAQRVLEAAVAALDALDVEGFVSVGSHADLSRLTGSDHVHVERVLDHAALVPTTSVFVTHGGWGSASRALAHGVPMVAIPTELDQPAVSRLLEKLGVSVTLKHEAISVEVLRDAIASVLAPDSSQRRAAATYAALGRDLPPPARAGADAILAAFYGKRK